MSYHYLKELKEMWKVMWAGVLGCCQGDVSMVTIVRQMLDETGFSKCGAFC
jgi:hypothetical protein